MRLRVVVLVAALPLAACGFLLGANDDDEGPPPAPPPIEGGPGGGDDASDDASDANDGGAPACADAAAPCAIATGVAGAFGLDLDDVTHELVFTQRLDAGSVYGVPATGGAVTKLFDWPLPSSVAHLDPGGSEVLYWFSEADGTVNRARRTTMPSADLVPIGRTTGTGRGDGRLVVDPAVGATHAVFDTQSNASGQVEACPISLSGCISLVTALDRPLAIAIDATYVYYATASGVISRVPRTPPFDVQYVPSTYPSVFAIAVTLSGTYWTASNGVWKTDDSRFQSPPTQISSITDARGIVADFGPESVWFVTDGGHVWHYTNGAATDVATWPEAHGLMLVDDADFLYWTWSSDKSGGVMRRPKKP
jgi:hypothetical protein